MDLLSLLEVGLEKFGLLKDQRDSLFDLRVAVGKDLALGDQKTLLGYKVYYVIIKGRPAKILAHTFQAVQIDATLGNLVNTESAHCGQLAEDHVKG